MQFASPLLIMLYDILICLLYCLVNLLKKHCNISSIKPHINPLIAVPSVNDSCSFL